jgi:hypothetical protein
MVDEKYYEETLDPNLLDLVPKDLSIEKARAFPLTRPRLIGDIGLRAFFQLYRKAKRIIRQKEVDFLYIPIPSFYVALLGRWLHSTTGVRYGIDYIDPWVHEFPGSNRVFSRAWLSTKVAKFLEPIAVRKASLITGVSEGYYKGVQDRNPHLLSSCVFAAMPYGGEERDHSIVENSVIAPYLFQTKKDKIQLVYAGAMLPKAYKPMETIFACIRENRHEFSNVEFHFIGTGRSPNDPQGYNIRSFAEQYGLWNEVVFEYPKRIPYLDVLVHLKAASGIFILGSTEPHYTPSKVYQGVLSKRPLLAVLHRDSSAVQVILQSRAGVVLAFRGEEEIDKIRHGFIEKFREYARYSNEYKAERVDMHFFNRYSAFEVTALLANSLEKIERVSSSINKNM